MDAGLDENQTEFTIFVLAVALEVLADGDSLTNFVSKGLDLGALSYWEDDMTTYLLDQEIEVLRDFWGKTCLTPNRSVSLSLLWSRKSKGTNAEAMLKSIPSLLFTASS
jgi:hypothetical protein